MEVGVGLLGYGTVGTAVHRLLVENAEDIERATGHRLRVERAVVHEASKRAVDGALAEIAQLPNVHAPPFLVPVVSDRGVVELGWA